MAQTANELLFDALVRHQTYLTRLGGGLTKELLALLELTESDLRMQIRDKLAGLNGLSDSAAIRRAEGLIANIESIRNKSWTDVQDYMEVSLTDLAMAEPKFVAGMLVSSVPVLLDPVLPAAAQLKAITTSNPFHGALLKQWAASTQAEDLRRIRSSIQVGMMEGEGTEAIVSRIFRDGGDLDMTRRQVEAIARTAVAHIAAESRDIMFEANADVIEQEQFAATLDARTTPVCRANDGKLFRRGKGPRPPLHIRCRSLRVPVLKKDLGVDRPFKPTTEKILVNEYVKKNNLPSSVKTRADLPRGTKGDFDKWAARRTRELIGTVPAQTSYNTWLKRQSVAFQEEVLGVAKSKLFRDGGLTLDKFVAPDGSELTLAQLHSKYAKAFKQAGIKFDF